MKRLKEKPAKTKAAAKRSRLSVNAETSPERQNGPSTVPDAEDDIDMDMEVEGGERVAGVYIPPPPVAYCSTESKGPRLIITHIKIHFFKSYADTQILGPFHKCFTSIIGPNGSGKSNVIDAMLFVFGYKSRHLRTKKLNVLLHKSEGHKAVDSGNVEVFFNQIVDLDDEKYEVVKNSEMSISRTVLASGQSFYCINGKRANFKEVRETLGKFGIDLLHNRFLILQGEVEQISLMKPKAPSENETGMLEYLEDIIGTSRFKEPLNQLSEKLKCLEEERSQRTERLKLAEKELSSLEEPLHEAVKFLELENEITHVTNRILQKELCDNKKSLKELLEEKKRLDENLQGFDDKLKGLAEDEKSISKEVSDKQKELDSLKKEKEKAEEENRNADNALAKLREEINQTNKRRKAAMESLKNDEKKLAELQKVPEKNQKDIEELTKKSEELTVKQREEEANLESVMSGIKEETQDLQDKKDSLNNELIGLNKIKNDFKAKLDLAKTELQVYVNNEQQEKSKLTQLVETLEKSKNALNEKQRLQKELPGKLENAKKELARCQNELEKHKRDEAQVNSELNLCQAKLAEKKNSLNAFTSRNRVLNFMMKKKQENVLPGIFGRLGDLGGIDPKYDCAISTACFALDYIVADCVNTSTAAVELLKKHDVGRATFIALDKQEGLKAKYRTPLKTPENVPRLFDLIKVEDERVRPAFYYALRDTLVANDLNQARRVAYGATRYRVVTLEGEIIEIAGTMSGGGREKRTGRMGRSATVTSDVNPDGLRKEEERVEKLRQSSSVLIQEINSLEEKIFQLQKDIKQWTKELNGINLEIKELSQQVPKLSQRVTDQETAVKAACPDQNAVQDMTEKVDSLTREFERAAESSGKVEKQVAKISEEIFALSGRKVKEAQKKLEDVSKHLDKVNVEITKLTVAIKTSVRNAKKTSDRICNLQNEITEAQEILRKFNEDLSTYEEKRTAGSSSSEKFTAKISEFDSLMKTLRQKNNEISKEMNAIKMEKLKEEQKSEGLRSKISAAKSSIPSIERKISVLKLHKIPSLTKQPEEEEENVDQMMSYEEDELASFDVKALSYRRTVLIEQLKDLSPNLQVIKDYEEKNKLCESRRKELEEVRARRMEVKNGHDQVKRMRYTEFMEGFMIISSKLKEMYQMITLGGDAEFDLVDSMDPFSEGIVFSVRPPKKAWKNIMNLSGGEKTLSSLALVFALHYYKPSPLYVMDEIDAALDFKNVSIVAHYIKERTKNAQFIIISLRPNMFELADVLVGIYKTNNTTKTVAITPGYYQGEKNEETAMEEVQN